MALAKGSQTIDLVAYSAEKGLQDSRITNSAGNRIFLVVFLVKPIRRFNSLTLSSAMRISGWRTVVKPTGP